jgi:hypothetical protein
MALVTVPDENRNRYEQPIQLRRLNVRLSLSSQDQSGYPSFMRHAQGLCPRPTGQMVRTLPHNACGIPLSVLLH